MSDKNLTLVTNDADPMDVANDMAAGIRKMYEDRDRKALDAKASLVERLKALGMRYRTANGVMSALENMHSIMACTQAIGTISEQLSFAKDAASTMSGIAFAMQEKAANLDPENMVTLCDGFYDKDYVNTGTTTRTDNGNLVDLTIELMTLQLCQNVGPNAEDIATFITHADKEIDKARTKLHEFCDENGIDFENLCETHSYHSDCLCLSCANDCKMGLEIEEGQSARVLCENFVEAEE